MAPAPVTPSFLRPLPLAAHTHPRFHSSIRLPPPSATFRVSEILGGRGLCNGEVGVRKELASSPPPPSTTASPDSPESSPSEAAAPAPPAVDPDAFEKEMMGLTGGFPGGEVGLKNFVAKNPPPPEAKKSRSKKAQAGTGLATPPRPPELPLFLPGMVVLVKNRNNAYHNYCGIVQRVTDGKVGVLFEGGNWDRLITFDLDELEGREKGPPMVNPKSVVLEELVKQLDDDDEEEEEAKAEEKKEGAAVTA